MRNPCSPCSLLLQAHFGGSRKLSCVIPDAATETRVPIQRGILLVNAIGYIGGLLGPALIGFIAHRIGLEYTFLILASGVLIVSLISYLKIRSGSLDAIKAKANTQIEAQQAAAQQA